MDTVSPAMVRIEMIVRPGAVGLLRRTACIVIAAYAAAMLPAVPAGTAPADGAVLAASAGAGRTAAVAQAVTSGSARSLGGPAAARDAAVSAVVATSFAPPAPPRTSAGAEGDQAGAARSRSAWGRIEITAGVLIICFAVLAVLAVQAARRRGRLARHRDLPRYPPPDQRHGGYVDAGGWWVKPAGMAMVSCARFTVVGGR